MTQEEATRVFRSNTARDVDRILSKFSGEGLSQGRALFSDLTDEERRMTVKEYLAHHAG